MRNLKKSQRRKKRWKGILQGRSKRDGKISDSAVTQIRLISSHYCRHSSLRLLFVMTMTHMNSILIVNVLILVHSIFAHLQITEALSFLHYSGQVIHKNVCPSSILVTKKGTWKLAGFEFIGELSIWKIPSFFCFLLKFSPSFCVLSITIFPIYFIHQIERCHENDSTEPVVCQPWSTRLSKMAQPNLDFMGKCRRLLKFKLIVCGRREGSVDMASWSIKFNFVRFWRASESFTPSLTRHTEKREVWETQRDSTMFARKKVEWSRHDKYWI